MNPEPSNRLPLFRLALLSAAALLLHGYHLGVEDAEIYLPAARRLLDPHLYPFAPEFFLSHGHLSLFSPLLAFSARLSHLSIDVVVFAWYCLCLLATIVATWKLTTVCFRAASARWTATALLTAVLAMPATNTGLLLFDPYLTARSFSTPLTLLSIAFFLAHRYRASALCVVLTGAFHPQMVVYLLFLFAVIFIAERLKTGVRERVPVLAAAGILPGGFHFSPASGPYREALYSRDYFFLYNWAWYHWLGVLAPLAFLAWCWLRPFRGTTPAFARLSFALIPFGALSVGAAALFASSTAFDMFERLQPMRSFHLITILFLISLGGFLGEYLVCGRLWRGILLIAPIAIGMFIVARQTYPNSPQVEFPSATSPNPWVNTLLWIRANVPADAVFAVDAHYLADGITDSHGFRAISGHSALADALKDSGVVSLFPALAPEWKRMSMAATGVNHFSAAQFANLRREYPAVSWTVIHGTPPAGFRCPYDEQGFAVCQLP